MKFNVFGNIENPKMILIHGVLTPWQIWTPQIEFFSKNYYIIVPTLDAHEEIASEFVSIQEEAQKIEQYYFTKFGKEQVVVCGMSMGGAIAHYIWKDGKLNILNLILDGAPLVPYGKFIKNIMIKNYLDIVHKSKIRDEKTIENFKKHFLPKKYLDDYLKFIDCMSDVSVKNIINSVSKSSLIVNDVSLNSRILYMHGTYMNEFLSKKSAKIITKYYPNTTLMKYQGAHVNLLVHYPLEWNKIVDNFLNKR